MSSDIDVLKLELQPFVKRSVTTLAGNVPGTTLVDASLVEAANFWNGCWVLLRTGTYAGQLRRVTGFAAGTVTLDHTVGGQIIAGVQYVMITRLPVDIIAGGGLKADLRQVLGQGADISPANPLLVGGNRAILQQVLGTLELITQDTGLNTNPERWLHDNHWDSGAELVLNAAAAVNLGVAVAAGATRRVRSITVRNLALVNTVITLSQAAPAQNRVSFDVPAQGARTWSEQDAVEFLAGVQPQISSSAAAAGAEAYIHASGVEA